MPKGIFKRVNGRNGIKILKICPNCNKEFKTIPSQQNKKYCCNKCYFPKMIGRPFCGGKRGWFKRGHKSFPLSEKEILRRRIAMSGNNNVAKRLEIRKKISLALTGKKQPNVRLSKLGEKSHFWKGGVTPINKRLRKCSLFKHWREEVFEKDNYTCWLCGERGGELHPHHLKSFSLYPALRFITNNGLTLCGFCHRTYTEFGGG